MNFLFKKKIIIIAIIIFVFTGIFFVYRAGRTITMIGGGGAAFWEDTAALFPKIPNKEEDRIDILILGIRGLEDDEEENGNFLADTIILASFNKKNNQASIVSIPRDLYVDIPEYGKEKINSAYAIGESRHYGGGGLQLMKVLVSIVSGVYVDYGVSIDFEGFKKIIDDLGGIVIYRDTPFAESKQWIYDGREGERYWRLNKSSTTTEIGLSSEEGWEFYVPRGANVMNSNEVLYYARSRYSSSDFDRMRRQQEVISAIKSKTLNLGILANPVKILNIMNTLENNVRTDMTISQMKDFISLIKASKIQDFKKEVITSGEEGLLVEDTIDNRFVLLPKAGNYSEIRELFKRIIE